MVVVMRSIYLNFIYFPNFLSYLINLKDNRMNYLLSWIV